MYRNGKILIVDDDPEIRTVIRVLLTSENFEVVEVSSGAEALEALTPEFCLVILDIMMPGCSGYETCQKIREMYNVPVLFLSAKSQSSDLVMGYSSGGDDYLCKPFSYTELLARVKGLIRRYAIYQGKNIPAPKTEYLQCNGIKLDKRQNSVYKNGEEINLTDTEYRILKLMMAYPGRVFSIESIYEQVWNEPYLIDARNSVMVFIRRIREKIEDDPRCPQILLTDWGRGYRIVKIT